MQFHQLVAFVRVAEQKSFSKAAESIFLSQSTVSTHISSLEKHFGQKLFDRMGKEVILTPFGERLYYWCSQILNLRDAMVWDLKEWTGKVEGSIYIAASTVPAQYMAPSLIARFLKKYPGIDFTLNQSDSQGVVECLIRGEADVGILGDMYELDKIKYTPFFSEKLVLITPKDIILASPVSILELYDYSFIFRKAGSGTQAVVEKIMKEAGLAIKDFKIIGYFDNVQSIKQAVKEGMGLSIISMTAAQDYFESGLINAYNMVEFNKEREFYLAYNTQKTLSPLAQEFIDFCEALHREEIINGKNIFR
ncbi:MAG: selenium metabolism-associated LysR family transcriptional regulator [Bacillota bacterium]